MTPPAPPRGACPSLAAPMPTGDGLLARLAGGPHWTPEAVLRLAEAAARHGNGVVEVTARGSWQARGLRPESAPAFAAELADLAGEAHVAVNPLAGEDPALVDPRPVAAAIAAGLPAVAPKLSVVVDGGGALPLDSLPADLRLVAAAGGWRLSLGAVPPRMVEGVVEGVVEAPAEAALRLLVLLGGRRAREVPETELGAVRAALAGLLRPAAPPAPRPAAEPLGVHRLGSRLALGVAPAFGSAEAPALAALARAARAAGATGLRPAPGRALLLTGLPAELPTGLPAGLPPGLQPGLPTGLRTGPACVAALREAAAALGFLTDPADPRRRVAACPGAPACASGRIGTRALAAALARAELPAAPPGRIALHVSGCAKGCAHPGAAPLTLVGGAAGAGLVRGGTARDAPAAWVPEAAAATLLPAPRPGATPPPSPASGAFP